MKKKIVVLITLLLFIAVPSAANAGTVYAFCSKDSQVNLRESPDPRSDLVAYAVLGEEINIDNSCCENGYYYTESCPGELGHGYISELYLSMTEPVCYEEPMECLTTAEVFLRKAPNGEKVKSMESNKILHVTMLVTDLSGVEWYKTEGGNYVMVKFITPTSFPSLEFTCEED